jgi:hypothetical protein
MAMLNSPDLQALLSMGVALTVAKLCSVWLHVELVLLGIALVSCLAIECIHMPNTFLCSKEKYIYRKYTYGKLNHASCSFMG